MVQLKWPKNLVVVRHGFSERNAAIDHPELLTLEEIQEISKIRDASIKLRPEGIRQAEETGKYLAKFEKFDICYSSPFTRTLQTSEAIISKFDYPLKIREDERLIEKSFGILDGMTKEDMIKAFPFMTELRKREGKYRHRNFGGDNYPDVEYRLRSYFGTLNRDWYGKNVLVVTHQVPYKMFRKLYERLNEEQVLMLPETPNCGIQNYKLDCSKIEEGRMKLQHYDHVTYGEELFVR